MAEISNSDIPMIYYKWRVETAAAAGAAVVVAVAVHRRSFFSG